MYGFVVFDKGFIIRQSTECYSLCALQLSIVTFQTTTKDMSVGGGKHQAVKYQGFLFANPATAVS